MPWVEIKLKKPWVFESLLKVIYKCKFYKGEVKEEEQEAKIRKQKDIGARWYQTFKILRVKAQACAGYAPIVLCGSLILKWPSFYFS